MSDESIGDRWERAVRARADGNRRSHDRRKRTEAAAFDLACAVSAFIVDARRRLGPEWTSVLAVLVRELDAYNDAREGGAARDPGGET